MRIWWINHFAVPPDQPGGTRHFSLARELIRRGHSVTIIASSVDYVTRRESRLAKGQLIGREEIAGVPFVWVKTPAYGCGGLARFANMWAFAWGAWRRLASEIPERPDIVIGSTPHPFAALAAERIAARSRVPFVLEVRDVWPQSLVDLGNHSPAHPFILLLDWLERYLCANAALILSLLPGASAHLISKGARDDSIFMLPNGIDLHLVPQPSESDEAQPFTVMYAGAHGLANGLDTLLDAAKLSAGDADAPRYVFVGDGPLRDTLRTRAESEGIDNVEFRASVPKSQIHSLLAQAHAFIFPLKAGPVFQHGVSPNKLFDYMAAGRPVIFSVGASNNPIAEANAGLTIEPEDAEGLATAVRELQSMPVGERRAMGNRARAYVEKQHDFALLALGLESALNAVCDHAMERHDQTLL